MAVEFILRCDNCGKRGLSDQSDGVAPRKTIEALRAADGGFRRFRPVANEGMKELCPKCVKKAESAKAKK